MMTKETANIVGGGITGLVIAYELLKKDYIVNVFEKSSEIGGLLSSFKMGQEELEYIYHHIFTSDTYVIDLLDELGIKDKLKWYEPKNGLYLNNHIYPFTTPFDLIKFGAIPFHERIKTGLSVLKAKNIKDYKKLEDITAKEWLIKNSGSKAYQVLWEPLLKSKFDLESDKVSAVWIWNKFKLRGNSRENIASENLGYLDGSFSTLIKTLVTRIEKMGGKVYINADVQSLKPTNNNSLLVKMQGETKTFESDKVIFATSAPVFKKIISDKTIDKSYNKLLDNIKYKANICMVLRNKRPLSSYYWMTICDQLSFVLIIEQNNLMPDKKYDGNVIYLSRYIDVKSKLWNSSEAQIYKSFIDDLKKYKNDFDESEINEFKIFKSEYSQPVVEKRYSKSIPTIATPIKGVYLAGMSQIYPEDRGMNYAIRLAYEVRDCIETGGSGEVQ